jgi:hypothetical protein
MKDDSVSISGVLPNTHVILAFYHYVLPNAIGKKLFYTSKKKPYRTFTIAGGSANGKTMGLDPVETLALKIKPSGDVTAVMAFDTGRKKKNKKTGKMEKVIYKATWQTTLLPNTTIEDGYPFIAAFNLYFAPNDAYGYLGYSKIYDSWRLLFWPKGKFAVRNIDDGN